MSRSSPVICSHVVLPSPLLKATSIALIELSLLCLIGCSTLVNGKHQALTIDSNPPGAAFSVEGITGVTPGTVTLERAKTNHTVMIKKTGYQTEQFQVGRKPSLWLAANIFLGYGLPIGLVVDFVTGAAYELGTDHVQATLHPENGVPVELPTPQASVVAAPNSESVAKSE